MSSSIPEIPPPTLSFQGGTSFAEPQERFPGSGSPTCSDAGKIEQQQAADSQVVNLPRQPIQIGRGPVRAFGRCGTPSNRSRLRTTRLGSVRSRMDPDGVRPGSGLEADHDGGVIEIDQRVQVVFVLQAGIDPEMYIHHGELCDRAADRVVSPDGIKVGEVELPQVKQVAVGAGQLHRLARGMQEALQRPIMGANSADGMDSLPVLDVEHWDHAKLALEHGFFSSTHNPGS